MKEKTIQITCSGKTEEDIHLAIDEAVRLIKEGKPAGKFFDKSISSSFNTIHEINSDNIEFKVIQKDKNGNENSIFHVDAKNEEEATLKAEHLGLINITRVEMV